MTSHNDNYFLKILIIGLIIRFNLVAAVEPELKLVNLVFRHGDRTPDNNQFEMYPNDPYLKHNFYPMGRGQLTNNGKRREYQLGEVLRKRYVNFLGKIYTPEAVAARSSDYDRTKMSLQLLLASLYPPQSIQRWNPLLNWQPIPAFYRPRVEDNLFLPDECPLFLAEYNRVLTTPKVAEEFSVFDNLRKNLTILTGKNITKPLDLYYLYLTFESESGLGLTLPKWADSIFPNGELWNGIIFAYKVGNYNTLLRRLYGGPFLRLITDDMISSINGTLKKGRKIHLYSGHETNIVAVLNALNVYKPHVPRYSSAVLFELYQLQDNYYVKIVHYLGIPSQLVELQLPDCEILCPIEKFLKIVADVIPSDEELICDKTQTADYANSNNNSVEQKIYYNLINKRNIGQKS